MKRASAAQRERASQLLAHEGAGGSAEACAAAAERIYEKLQGQLVPLLGAAGVHALFVRSAKLTHREAARLDISAVENSTKLHDFLHTLPPDAAAEAAVVLFATFLGLIVTFIGERLTSQLLRSAWPTMEGTATKEREK